MPSIYHALTRIKNYDVEWIEWIKNWIKKIYSILTKSIHRGLHRFPNMELVTHEKIKRRGEIVDKTHECLLQASKCNNGGGVMEDGPLGGLCPGLSLEFRVYKGLK